MKRVIQIMELNPIPDPKSASDTVLTIGSSWMVRHTSVMARQRHSGIIQSAVKPITMELVPVVIFEINPEILKDEGIDRHFVIIPPGMVIDSPHFTTYSGSFTYPDGSIFFLYEVDGPDYRNGVKELAERVAESDGG